MNFKNLLITGIPKQFEGPTVYSERIAKLEINFGKLYL